MTVEIKLFTSDKSVLIESIGVIECESEFHEFAGSVIAAMFVTGAEKIIFDNRHLHMSIPVDIHQSVLNYVLQMSKTFFSDSEVILIPAETRAKVSVAWARILTYHGIESQVSNSIVDALNYAA